MLPASPFRFWCNLIFESSFATDYGCGGRIRTADMRIMRPLRYHCATPRCKQCVDTHRFDCLLYE